MLEKELFSERGVSSIEYAILIGTISLMSMGGITAFGMGVADNIGLVANLSATSPNAAQQMITATATITPTPIPATPVVIEERPLKSGEIDSASSERNRASNNYFFDDFSDGDVNDWFTPQGGDWHLENDRYGAGPVFQEHRTFAGIPGWKDYTVTVKAELSQGDGYGIYFRATNPKKVNAYIFQYDPGFGQGAFLFRQVIKGEEQYPFAINRAPDNYDWYNKTHTISIKVQGDTFTAYVDDQQVLQGSLDAFKIGQFGLRTWWLSSVCFDDVTVTPLEEAEDDLVNPNIRARG